jgi:type IV fimbrial biogenesis protein FimT
MIHSILDGIKMLQKNNGFSIIEVLIVVAISAILTAIAIPAFNVFIGNTRTNTIANEFVSALNLARSEAMKRGGEVYACRTSNGEICATGGAWGQGWLVADQSNSLIRVHDGLKEPSSFIGLGAFAADKDTKVTFRSNGMLKEAVNEDNDYFKIENMARVLCIKVNQSGRVRTSKSC